MTKSGRFVFQQTNLIQDLPDLPGVVALWLSHTRASAETKAGYLVKLSPFVDWYGPRNEFSKNDLVDFNQWMIDNGHSDKNRFEVIRRCKQFFKWLFDNGMTPDHNVAKWFPAVEVEREMRIPANVAQIAMLMQAANRGELPHRDRALIAVMLGTGVRRN